MPVLLNTCLIEFFSLIIFHYSAPYSTVTGLRHFHLYTQITMAIVN